MELKIDKEWFEKRAALEADHEIGAGGSLVDGRPNSGASETKAWVAGLAAVVLVASLQFLVPAMWPKIPIFSLGDAAVFATFAIIFTAMVIAYGGVPIIVGALLAAPILGRHLPAYIEYPAIALCGIVAFAAIGPFFLPGGWSLPIWPPVLPALAGLFAYRSFRPRRLSVVPDGKELVG